MKKVARSLAKKSIRNAKKHKKAKNSEKEAKKRK
jgi:hypothetical protein